MQLFLFLLFVVYFNDYLFIFRVHVFENGTLVLYSAGDEDAGTYKCLGVSQSGLDQAFTAQLLLACKYHSLEFIYVRAKAIFSLSLLLSF